MTKRQKDWAARLIGAVVGTVLALALVAILGTQGGR